jgi:broad specificity phosphatase PhoE
MSAIMGVRRLREARKLTTIVLIRHGETEWNREEIFRGRADVELNETGLQQAQLLAQYLADQKIDAIYSSPLKRALTTAEKITIYQDVKVNIASELIDFDYGEWQGLSHDAVRQRYDLLYKEWLKNPQLVKIPHGETLNDVRSRTLRLVDRINANHNGTVALISHRVIGKVLICALLALDNSHFWNIRLDTCGITTFTREDERFVLVKHNDTSFLKPLGKTQLSDF